MFSTYFGEAAGGPIAVDSSGNAFVSMGASSSLTHGPLPAGVPATTTLSPCAGGIAGFPTVVVEFSPDGSLVFAAPFGGTTYDSVAGTALDNAGNLYLGGSTQSGDFPSTPGVVQQDLNGTDDGFVAKISLASTSPPLQLAAACIVNAATYANWAPLSGSVSPGEIISIFGDAIGPPSGVGAVLDSQGRIATSLAGVSLTFDGIAAPLLYAQSNQVNAIVPFEVAGKQFTEVQLQYNELLSTKARMHVADAVPGIFTVGGE